MSTKKLIPVFVLFFLFSIVPFADAQKTTTAKKENKTTMQKGDMQQCMNTIAADSSMRRQMMSKMMEHARHDTAGMRQMCMTMMNNPEMHKMMMTMMNKGEKMSKRGMMERGIGSPGDTTMMRNREPAEESNP